MGFLKSWLGGGTKFQVCHPGILCEPLEERIVLNAAVAVANQDHTDQTNHVQTQDITQPVATPTADQNHLAGAPTDAAHASDNLGQVTQNDLHVVLVSNALDHLQGISAAAYQGTHVIVLDDAHSNLASVDQMLGDLVASTGQKIGELAILSHGNDGLISLGSDQITLFNLNSFRPEFQQLSTLMAPNAQIQLFGCSVAGDSFGKGLVDGIALYTGTNVFASTDSTGGTTGNWVLEYSTNPTTHINSIVDTDHLASLDVGLAAPYPAYDNTWGVSMNGVLYFVNDDGIHGKELWSVTATGLPSMVADINPGAGGSNPAELTVLNGVLYFSASDGNGQGSHGTELWRSDGTAAGTYMVADINPGNQGSDPHGLTVSNGSLYFAATDGNGAGSHGTELFKTDGTAANTVLVADINPGQLDSNPSHLTDVNGVLFFSASDGNSSSNHGNELWRTDGTAAGTYMVADIYSGNHDSNPDQLINANGILFFSASDGNNAASHGTELWRSDGTAVGTYMVADINPGNHDSHPTGLVNVNGTVYFAADDGTYGNELWSSDGTLTGTQMVKDINPGQHDSNPAGLLNIAGVVYFAADDGSHGNELWSTDGTSAGTQMVQDINPGSGSSGPKFLNNYNGALIFAADDGTHGYEPWQSDGTAAGTFLMKDINPNGSSFPLNFARLNPLFFLADDGHGFKLWKTDGTVTGTVKVSDVSTGSIVASTDNSTVSPPSDTTGGTAAGNPALDTLHASTDNANSTGIDSFAQKYLLGDKLKEKGFHDLISKTLFPLFSTTDVTAEGQPGSHHPSSKIKPGAGQAEFFPNLESAGSVEQPGEAKTHSDTNHHQDVHVGHGEQPLPGAIKVIVLKNGDYSVRTDMFSLVVGAEVWVPPMVKWYLAAVSEGRYQPGSLPAGFERMMWDFLQYTASRKAEGQPPVPELELRLAWQWAEWRRQISKTQGSVDALPWTYFRGLSEAMILFYGGGKDGHADFSQAVNAMHQNIRNLTIIPIKLPEELHSRATDSSLPR
jgi:ELWxxDGT repeat protein